jgi:hypothetical protein
MNWDVAIDQCNTASVSTILGQRIHMLAAFTTVAKILDLHLYRTSAMLRCWLLVGWILRRIDTNMVSCVFFCIKSLQREQVHWFYSTSYYPQWRLHQKITNLHRKMKRGDDTWVTKYRDFATGHHLDPINNVASQDIIDWASFSKKNSLHQLLNFHTCAWD